MENRVGTYGGENLDEKADIELQKSSDSFLTNLASRDLMEHWRAGSQDAARVLWARYQVRLVALVAARLNRRYRNGIAAEDVVQSAITLEADEILADLHSQLTSDQTQLLDLLLENATQREIAERLKVDERTVRRRIAAIRAVVAGHLADVEHQEPSLDSDSVSISLPKITYREFVLGKMVGRGALGKVYRARLQSDEQVVAVKFMHRHLWTNPASKLSFLREIDHASQIDHQGILKDLGWGQSPHGGPYLVSEYVDGVSITNAQFDNASTAVQCLFKSAKRLRLRIRQVWYMVI